MPSVTWEQPQGTYFNLDLISVSQQALPASSCSPCKKHCLGSEPADICKEVWETVETLPKFRVLPEVIADDSLCVWQRRAALWNVLRSSVPLREFGISQIPVYIYLFVWFCFSLEEEPKLSKQKPGHNDVNKSLSIMGQCPQCPSELEGLISFALAVPDERAGFRHSCVWGMAELENTFVFSPSSTKAACAWARAFTPHCWPLPFAIACCPLLPWGWPVRSFPTQTNL